MERILHWIADDLKIIRWSLLDKEKDQEVDCTAMVCNLITLNLQWIQLHHHTAISIFRVIPMSNLGAAKE